MAATLYQVEQDYGESVNFVMVNADQSQAMPLIQALGVDAIPHLAMIESDGTVDTALIGPVPKQWLERDLQVLVDNAAAETTPATTPVAAKEVLPYQMLDVFANRPPEARKIKVTVKEEAAALP